MDETPLIQRLHSAYVRATRLSLVLDMRRIFAWNQWRSHGWDVKELETVIIHLKRKIANNQKWPSSLQFRNLIENTSNFEEELAEARAVSRRPVVDKGRADVLRATCRPVTPETASVQTSGDVLAGAKAFADFQRWRAEAGL